MVSETYTKLLLAVVIVFGALYSWYAKVGKSVDDKALQGNISVFSGKADKLLSFFGLEGEVYCPYTNPYAFSLFSSGSLAISSKSPVWDAFVSVIDTTKYSCKNLVRFESLGNGYFDVSCDGKPPFESIPSETLAENFNTYVKSNKEGMYLMNTVPAWQCYFFFALLPFFAFYFLVMDFINYLPLRDKRLKRLMGAFISAFSIFTGSLTNFIWNLAFISGLNVKGTFIMTIFLFVFISIIFTWIKELNVAQARAYKQTGELSKKMKAKAVEEVLAETFSKKEDDETP